MVSWFAKAWLCYCCSPPPAASSFAERWRGSTTWAALLLIHSVETKASRVLSSFQPLFTLLFSQFMCRCLYFCLSACLVWYNGMCYKLQVHTAAEKGTACVSPPQGHLSLAPYAKLRDIPLPHFSPFLSHMLNTFEQYIGHHKKKMKMDLRCFIPLSTCTTRYTTFNTLLNCLAR